jgi:hypothetical protein
LRVGPKNKSCLKEIVMKILEIDYDYYYYPQDISCIDDFIKYANGHYNSFIKLTRFETENCVFPYFIKEETKDVKPSQKEVKTSTAKSTKTASKPATKKVVENAEVVEDKKKTTAKTPAKKETKTTVSKTSKK